MVPEENEQVNGGQLSPITRAGDFLFLAPRCGRWNRDTGERNVTIETQTVQALKKMARFLEEAGASFDDIVQVNVLLANKENMKAMERSYTEFFKDKPNKNHARYVIVTDLPDKDMMILMGSIAYHPRQTTP